MNSLAPFYERNWKQEAAGIPDLPHCDDSGGSRPDCPVGTAARGKVMMTVDINQNRRIARLAQLKRELAESRTLDATIETLQRAFFDVENSVASILLTTAGLPSGHYRHPPARRTARRVTLRWPRRGGRCLTLRRNHRRDHRRWTTASAGRCRLDTRSIFFCQTLGEYSSTVIGSSRFRANDCRWTGQSCSSCSPNAFTERELEEAIERATLAGALLENQLLVEELTRAHEQIDRDAQHVGRLQRALLPASLPRVAGLEIATSYEPCGCAGGDMYDFFPLEQPATSGGDRHPTNATFPSRWCVFIGDASGQRSSPPPLSWPSSRPCSAHIRRKSTVRPRFSCTPTASCATSNSAVSSRHSWASMSRHRGG